MADTMTMDRTGTAPETDRTTGTQFKDQTKKVKDDLRELGRIGKEFSQEKMHDAKDAAGRYLEKGRERATQVEDSVVTYVREKPVKSLAMAIGGGFLLGFLLRRR